MNKLNVSSKMHLFIIVSALIVAVGLAVGLVCQFVAGGFFGSGAGYASYKAVTVKYSLPATYDEVSGICEEIFEENGVGYYTVVSAENSGGDQIEYRFTASTDGDALKAAAEGIDEQVGIAAGLLGSASYSENEGRFGGTDDMMYAGIALAAAVVFQFVYFAIRYKFTMAIAAFVADLHNLLIFLALLAITRVQISVSVVAVAVFAVLLTMVCCGMLFDKMRKNFKQDSYKSMSSFEQVDVSLGEAFKPVTFVNVVLASAFVLVLVLGLFAGAGIFGLFMPCAAGVLAVAACQYGCLFLTPAIYSRLKLRADKHAASKVSRYSGAKKAADTAE